jgi:hypothetical protein
MPDIREILAAIDENDRLLWQKHRTELRRSYLTAHNSVHGIVNWSDKDDTFMDLIDIQLALLFDRAGRFDAPKDIIGADGNTIIKQIEDDVAKAKAGWSEK